MKKSLRIVSFLRCEASGVTHSLQRAFADLLLPARKPNLRHPRFATYFWTQYTKVLRPVFNLDKVDKVARRRNKFKVMLLDDLVQFMESYGVRTPIYISRVAFQKISNEANFRIVFFIQRFAKTGVLLKFVVSNFDHKVFEFSLLNARHST